MKRIGLLLAVLGCLFGPFAAAKKVSALFDYARFKLDGDKTLLELYLDIESPSVRYQMVQGRSVTGRKAGFQGKVNWYAEIWKQDKLITNDAITLISPILDDTSGPAFNLSSMMRLVIPATACTLKIRLQQDHPLDTSEVTFQMPIDGSEMHLNSPHFSDIQLAREVRATKKGEQEDEYVKSGVRIQPYASNFYPANISAIQLYSELYELSGLVPDSSKAVLTIRFIKLPTFEMVDELGATQVLRPAKIIPILKSVAIQDLPSGHYRLQLTLIGPDGKIIALKDKNFFRSNPTADKDNTTNTIAAPVVTAGTFVDSIKGRNIKQYVYHLGAIASRAESGTINLLIQGTDYAAMRSFYLEFWQRRNKKDPESAHKEYRERVLAAYSKYGSRSRPLLESDRARVVLRYGEPNQINNEMTDPKRINASNGVNYEIWFYYQLEKTSQTDVEFVFVRDEASSQYVLVHSNATGERRNDNWRSNPRASVLR